MRLHHDKHHQTYVDRLNAALEGQPDLAGLTLEELLLSLDDLPEDMRTAVRNHGGGHANHSLFWLVMAPNGGRPGGKIADAVSTAFGSVADFQQQFSQLAEKHFGDGHAWLVMDSAGTLRLLETDKQDNPLMVGAVPLLGLDVWEHAYYLKYNNRRADYIKAWWNVVDWATLDRLYAEVS
jgi:superoxide dismutase, Fe-Mn family